MTQPPQERTTLHRLHVNGSAVRATVQLETGAIEHRPVPIGGSRALRAAMPAGAQRLIVGVGQIWLYGRGMRRIDLKPHERATLAAAIAVAVEFLGCEPIALVPSR